MNQEDQKILYEWEAPEFSGGSTAGWSGWTLAFLLVAAIWTAWVGQWVTLVVVVMVGLVIYLLRRIQPRTFWHRILETGVEVGGRVYPYSKLKLFWIVLGQEARVVNILPNRKFGLLLTLQIGDVDVEKIREILGKFLPEDASRGEDPVDRIGRFFKL